MAELISDEYLKLNRTLHNNPEFGGLDQNSGLTKTLPNAIIRLNKLGKCNSILDYGTGKGLLVKRLKKILPREINITGYDPAVTEFSKRPEKQFDVVTCLDVLEHVDYNNIDFVIKDLASLTQNMCFICVDLQPAKKKLSNGHNAHVLLAPPDWWVAQFNKLFPCLVSYPIYVKETGMYSKVIIYATRKPSEMRFVYEFAHITGLHNATASFT